MVLEVTVWDKNSSRKTNDFLGGLHIGPDANIAMATHQRLSWMDSMPEEAEYWSAVLSNAGVYVERWLPLRPTMQSRNVPTTTRLSSAVPSESKDREVANEEGTPLPPSPEVSTTPATAVQEGTPVPPPPTVLTITAAAVQESAPLPPSPTVLTTPVIAVQDSPGQVCNTRFASVLGEPGEEVGKGCRRWGGGGEGAPARSFLHFQLPTPIPSLPVPLLSPNSCVDASHPHLPLLYFPTSPHTSLPLAPPPTLPPPHFPPSHPLPHTSLPLTPPPFTCHLSPCVGEARLQAPRGSTATAGGSRAHSFSVGEL